MLLLIHAACTVWERIQRRLQSLNRIFDPSNDFRTLLPEAADGVEQASNKLKDLLPADSQFMSAKEMFCAEGRLEALEEIDEVLYRCTVSLFEVAMSRCYATEQQGLSKSETRLLLDF